MSYLVLARKWRPKRFAELVGQEHVVRALTNALQTGRVHHAFLFTGTRGVGKTTIARIFAKSLNCERGTSSDPCGECETCLAIDAGRYIDLLEIDAASNTGVDNVRELIENAQYMPSRGKYKVYLIDEVHMLSKPAFNALLKTLEEPPDHVKFLFATTDPEKLLVTVLSRCLQFNLKRLDEAQIAGQLRKILAAEGIEADDDAIGQLARAADGSLRDGLSLLDQAIAYAGGRLEGATVANMLGTVDRSRVQALLAALADADGARLLEEAAQLAEFSPDWGSILDAFAHALHRIQVKQLVPAVDVGRDSIDGEGLAARLRPELVQLWYQMALHGRRDLELAPSPRSGFEMTLLRMLAFRPEAGGQPRADAPAPAGQRGLALQAQPRMAVEIQQGAAVALHQVVHQRIREQLDVGVAGAAAVEAQHQARGVQAVEVGAQRAIDVAAQGGRILAELGASLLQGGQDLVAGGDDLRAGIGGGGRRGLRQRGRGGQQRHAEGEGEAQEQGFHGLASVGVGAVAGAGVGAPPPNMYLPASWIRSTAGWVKAICSPGLRFSGSPPGCRPT